MDLAYYEFPPGIQLLDCLEFDSHIEGRESTLLDAFQATEAFREKYPKEFTDLTKYPACFKKEHYERKSPVDMVFHLPHIVLNEMKEIIDVNWSPPFEGPTTLPLEEMKDYHHAYVTLARFYDRFQKEKLVLTA